MRPCPLPVDGSPGASPELAAVWGLEPAKRALEVAAAGGHPLLLVGPTGAGKSLLARCLPGLLPPLGPADAQAVAEVHVRAGMPLPPGRPVRTPGGGLSPARLLGGRLPGEAQLACHGVLIFDDLAALSRAARQALCEALDGRGQAPSFLLVAALRSRGACAEAGAAQSCPPVFDRHYRARIDEALLDRFDLCIEVEAPTRRELACVGERSAAVAARVAAACLFRAGRPAGVVHLDPSCRALLAAAVERLGLSPRAVARTQQIARTIADLAGSPQISRYHLAEALAYRSLLHSQVWLAPARAGESEPGTDGRPRRGPTAAPLR